MNKLRLVSITESTRKEKKLMAIFINNTGTKHKTVHFGARGMSDYTIHKDNLRKERYLARHKNREDWDNYMSAGSLSRWILWNKKSLRASIIDYKKRFGL